MVREYDYYLFDADGTLFDTTEMICKCFEHTAQTFGKPYDRELVKSHIGMTLRKQMEIYYGPLTDETFETYRNAHMSYQLSIFKDYLVLCPGVKEALSILVQNGKKCAVVTSRMISTLEIYLKEMGIINYFEALVTPESTLKHKPDPQPALKALELLDGTPQKAVFIGDSPFDIECGKSAGMDTAFVNWSHNNKSLLSVKPVYYLNDMRQLCEIYDFVNSRNIR